MNAARRELPSTIYQMTWNVLDVPWISHLNIAVFVISDADFSLSCKPESQTSGVYHFLKGSLMPRTPSNTESFCTSAK